MNQEFKNNLITGLLSSPIIYLKTSHYKYVDEMLMDIVKPKDGTPKILNLNMDHLAEFDLARGCVYFDTKFEDADLQSIGTIQDFIKMHISLDNVTVQISIIKNCDH